MDARESFSELPERAPAEADRSPDFDELVETPNQQLLRSALVLLTFCFGIGVLVGAVALSLLATKGQPLGWVGKVAAGLLPLCLAGCILTFFLNRAVGFGAFAFKNMSWRVELFPDGLLLSNADGESRLEFDDIESYTLQILRVFHGGRYLQHQITLEVVPKDRAGGAVCKILTCPSEADAKGRVDFYNRLNEALATAFTARWLRRLEKGKAVELSPKFSVVREGFVAGSRGEAVSFTKLLPLEVKNGKLEVEVDGWVWPAFTTNNTRPLFSAHVMLLKALEKQARGGAPA